MANKLLSLNDFLNEENVSIDTELENFGKAIAEDAKDEYEKYFNAKLKEFDVDSPADLSEEEKKKFFNELKKGWSKEDSKPKNEAVEIDELSVKLLNFEFSVNENAKEEYQKYFKAKLEEFEVSSPAELSDEKKKEFFDAIKDGWDSDAGKPKENAE